MNTWSLRGTAAAVGIAAVIAGVGGAAVYAATDSGPRMMGMHGGPGPGQGHWAGGSGHAQGHDTAARDAGPDSAAVHGEFVVANGTGGFTTMVSQTGRITAISDASVTARSDDGYSQTYVIPAANPGGIATLPPFAVNDEHRAHGFGHHHQLCTDEGRPSGPSPRTGASVADYLASSCSGGSGAGPVTDGSAIVVVGVGGGAVSVTVSPASVVSAMVASLVVTGPGGIGSGSAELDSLNATDNAPMASTAPAPAVAVINFSLVVFTSDHSNSISSRG
jgi:hypothetical protein